MINYVVAYRTAPKNGFPLPIENVRLACLKLIFPDAHRRWSYLSGEQSLPACSKAHGTFVFCDIIQLEKLDIFVYAKDVWAHTPHRTEGLYFYQLA